MRVAVTGASGFIGNALCLNLLKRGHEVAGLCRTRMSLDNFNSRSFRHIQYAMGDLLPQEAIAFSPEVLVHLAWEGIPDFSERRCVENIETQIQFLRETEKFVELKKIVGTGTCREYGAKQGACAEDERVLPDSHFSWAKQVIADYLRLLTRDRLINFVWFRIFYIYGPGQRSQSLIPTLIDAIKSNRDPIIRNPAAANDFIFIDDVVDALARSIEQRDQKGTFNLGSGKTATVARITEIVEKVIRDGNPFSDCLEGTVEVLEPTRGMWADTTLSERELGWYSQIGLVEGIRRTCSSSHP